MSITLPNRNILLPGTPLKPLMWVSATNLARSRSIATPVYLWTHNFTEDRKALLNKDPQNSGLVDANRKTVRKRGVAKVALNAQETRDDQPIKKTNKKRHKKGSHGKECNRRTKDRDRKTSQVLISGHGSEGETKREVLVSVNRNSPDPHRDRKPDVQHKTHQANDKCDAKDVRKSEASARSLRIRQYKFSFPAGSAQPANLDFPPDVSSPAVRRSLATKVMLSRPFVIDENLGDQEYGQWASQKLRSELGSASSAKVNLGSSKFSEDEAKGNIALEPDVFSAAISKSKNANCCNVELHQSTPPAPIAKYPPPPKILRSKKRVAFETASRHRGGSAFADVKFGDLSLRPKITTVSESIYPFPPPSYIYTAPPSAPHVQTTDTLVIGTGMTLSTAKTENVALLKKIDFEKKRRASCAASHKHPTPKLGRSVSEDGQAAVPIDEAIVGAADNDIHREAKGSTDVSGSRKLSARVVRKDKTLPRSTASATVSARASSEKELRRKIVIPGPSTCRPHSSPSTSKSSRRPRSSSSSKSKNKERRMLVSISTAEFIVSEEERLAKTMIIQRWTRMCLARRRYQRILRAVPIIQEFWRKYTSYMPPEFYS